MRRVSLALLAAAVLAAPPVWAQSEMEIYQQTGDGLLANHREALQQNIDRATRALQAKDYVGARKAANAVTRADPKRIEAWRMLGAANIGLQDWKRARAAYAQAIRLYPADPEARAGLGVAMAKTRDPGAQEQLAWLSEKAAACGARCVQLAKYKSDVESAIAEAAKGS